MSIEAMKQALKALEEIHPGNMTPMAEEAWNKVITALRKAIEQAEKLKPTLWLGIGGDGRVKYTTDSDRALKWKQAGSYRLVRDYYTSPVHASDISQERVDETAKDRHEPVAWLVDGEIKVRLDMAGKLYYSETNVYAAPPQREWVGLTDKEVTSIIREWHWMPYELCKVIEAKLKEKNCSAANNS